MEVGGDDSKGCRSIVTRMLGSDEAPNTPLHRKPALSVLEQDGN